MKTLVLVSILFLCSCSGGSDSTETSPAPAPISPPAPVADTTAPILSLLGESVVSVEQGTTYFDQGASASDDTDGDISSDIVTTGTVNAEELGEYRLNYAVSDGAGNAAEPIERIVRVVNEQLFLQVSIETNGAEIVDEPKILATMQMHEAEALIYSGNIGIEIRGSSSQLFDKKSYGFETWDSQGEDTDFPLAGFPEEEDWIFYGPYSDKSLLRNVLIYQLSNDMGRYATRTAFSELTINGEYRGVYVLMEKIKRDKNRVDISKLKDEDITGGYIIKIDKTTGENESIDFSFASEFDGFGSENGLEKIQFIYEYPKPEDINAEQKNYIQGYIHEFETVLLSENFADPLEGYQKYIDVPSFVDFLISNELSHNVDAYRISTFMHKDKGGKLKMGPIWDFNIAFGNANYCRGHSSEDWAFNFNFYCPGDLLRVPFWWERLLEDPNFVSALKSRWAELRNDVLATEKLTRYINEYATRIKFSNSATRNFAAFDLLGKWIWPNFYVGETYDQEVDFLINWIEQRVLWMDQEIERL